MGEEYSKESFVFSKWVRLIYWNGIGVGLSDKSRALFIIGCLSTCSRAECIILKGLAGGGGGDGIYVCFVQWNNQ